MSLNRSVHLYSPGQDLKVKADLETSKGMFIYRPEKWVEKPRQISFKRSSGSITVFHGDRHEVVADYKPRILWGEDAGEPFTVLDARMRVVDGLSDILPAQIYEASSVLRGAHVEGEDTLAEAVRIRFTLNHAGWMRGEAMRLPQGRISPWAGRDGAGLVWEPGDPVAKSHTVRYFRQRFTSSILVLLELWTGEKFGIQSIEVYLPGAGWCTLESLRVQAVRSPRHPLLSPSDLSMPILAKWLEQAPKLGTVPFLAVADQAPLQAQAQLLTTAFEGLHERLHPGTARFTVSSNQRKKAIKVAAEEAARLLAKSGIDTEVTKNAYREALSQAHQPSYVTRMEELAPRIEITAPGLMGPSTSEWIRDIRDIRNTLSHGATRDDDFGEEEISRYYVLTNSARWALQIRLLLELVDERDLQTALWHYDRFMFALANIDREQYWTGYSAYDQFSEAARKATRTHNG